MKCPMCKGEIKKTKEPYFFGEIRLGEFEAEKGGKCGEVFFTEEEKRYSFAQKERKNW